MKDRSVLRCRSAAVHTGTASLDDSALRLRITEIIETRVHYGYCRVHVMLKRVGWCDNYKSIYRLYRENVRATIIPH